MDTFPNADHPALSTTAVAVADAPVTRCSLTRIDTPIGEAIVIEDAQQQLRVLDWADHAERWQRMFRRHAGADTVLVEVADSASARALRAYLGGRLDALDGLVTATTGTAFQRAVWAALRQIPVCETRSYAELAAAIGRPSAVRAVAAANAANPISIVVPCHRVIGSNGALTGYAGGVERKAWLLRHEKLGPRA
jgi:methylated-DNA-[protein]-cysteine S-methyltransferase